MIDDLRIALLGSPELQDPLGEQFAKIFNVQSVKDLVRLLIEKEIDVIVTPQSAQNADKVKKISQSYKVPVLNFFDSDKPENPVSATMEKTVLKSDVLRALAAYSEKIENARLLRGKLKLQAILDGVTNFTNRVPQTTKELFIADTCRYFSNHFKLQSCHWVEVKSANSKLPPILKLRHELEKQKVDQGDLIKALDSCSSAAFEDDSIQIWKTNNGDYVVMLWIHLEQDDAISQCVLLRNVQFKTRSQFQALLEALVPFLVRRWSLCLMVGEAREQVFKDSLTDLYNQKFLNEVLDRKIEEYKRYKTPFSILFIDVDHFKRVNDSLGHVVGSGVLKELGNLLQKQIRNSDYAFRYGGDEFIILLAHTEGQDALNVAERIRQIVEEFHFKFNEIRVNITVSIGLAFFPVHADSAEDIIRIADEAMYYGKSKSRNVVYKAS